jgi:glycosyltransferase involved in cell wall biosynthesis
MTELNPLVSFLMTAYNRELFIADAIESVLRNRYQNFELIVVDDASHDNTVSIVRNYSQIDPRIKLYVNSKNLGDYPNRNRAASYATGEFLMYVDSDDRLNPDTVIKILNGVNDINEFNFAMYWPFDNASFILDGSEAIQKHFYEKQFLYMGPGGTFLRRSFFARIGCYPEKYGPANDMYFNLKACCHSHIYLFPFEFVDYRRHAGQEIRNSYGYLCNNYTYMRDALIELPLPFNTDQIRWLVKKNKRRFVVNLIMYFFRSFHVPKTVLAWRKADFSFKYLLEAIFQFS